jgi:nucleotide-binding universal stress UspA family protein
MVKEEAMKANKILVPLDGSEMAEAALAPALEMAHAGSSLILMRAADPRVLPGADVIGAQIQAVREAEDYLGEVKEGLEKALPGRIEAHVWYGPAASAIVEAARVQKVDVIVMSSHGRSELGRVIIGSVAESVLRGTRVPILLVRASSAPVDIPAGQGEARPAEQTQPTTRTEARR